MYPSNGVNFYGIDIMKKKEVILHIGLHKTGTTSIQSFMIKNKALLEEHDYVCLNNDGTERVDGNSYHLLKRTSFSSKDREFYLDIPLLKKMILSSDKKKVIVSTEAFSWVSSEHELRQLKSELRAICDSISIICYVRDGISFAKSIYSEACKPVNCLSVLHNFYYKPLDGRILEDKFKYHYYTLENLVVWKNVFIDNKFIARKFDINSFYQNNLICDFLHEIGCNNKDLCDLAINWPKTNESISYLQAKYMSRVKKYSSRMKDGNRWDIENAAYNKIDFLKCNRKVYFSSKLEQEFYRLIEHDLKKNMNILGLTESSNISKGESLGQSFINHCNDTCKMTLFSFIHLKEILVGFLKRKAALFFHSERRRPAR